VTGGFVLGEVLFLQGVVTHTGILAVLLSVILFVLWIITGKTAGGSRKMRLSPVLLWLYVLIGAGSIISGHARIRLEHQWMQTELDLGLDGRRMTVSGTLDEVTSNGSQTTLLLKDCTAWNSSRTGRLKRIQVYLQSDAAGLQLGNIVRINGKVSAIDRAANPGEFDYQMYYRSKKINYRVSGQAAVVTEPTVSRYREYLRRAGDDAGMTLDQIAGPDAGFYQAMVLGDKQGLDENLQELYQRNGISHLFAISGLHMSLIGMGLYRLIRRSGAGFLLSGIAGAFLIICYVTMVGLTASVVRAMVMLLAAFLAAWLGRTYDLLSALALAVLLILGDSPYQLCQAGFQLSAGAVLGVGLLVPELERLCPGSGIRFTPLRVCRQGVIAGAGIQLATLPVLLYHFFQIPLYGIFLNPIVIPLMGMIVISGIAGIFLGKISLAAGVFAVGAGHYVLQYYEWICRIFASLPGSSLVWGRPQFWQIILYYPVLGGIVWLAGHRQLKRVLLLTAAACFLLCPLPVKGLQVTFLDVGQGDGIVIRTKDHTILIDGGSSSIKKLGQNRLEPFLKSNGITTIDYAYVSHADTDHISGLVYLLENGQDIRILNLMVPALGREDDAYRQLVSLTRDRGGEVFWIAEGHSIGHNKLRLTCLYPGEQDQAPDRNAQSTLLKVEYGSFHMLLTGDMGEAQEMAILGRPEVRREISGTQVLKLAHHGSRMSSTAGWLELVDPVWAVVSYGEDNSYGHPHEEVKERLLAQETVLFETAKYGAVWLETNGTDIRWKCFNSP